MVSPKPLIGVNIIYFTVHLFVYHLNAGNLVHGIAIDGENGLQRNKFFFAQKHDLPALRDQMRIIDLNEEIIPNQKTSTVDNDVNDSKVTESPAIVAISVENSNSTKLPSRISSVLALLNNVLENVIELTSDNSQQQVASNAVTYFKILSNIFNEAVEKIIKNTENCSDNEEVSHQETSAPYITTTNSYNLTMEKILEDKIQFLENPTTAIEFNVTEEKTLEDNIRILDNPDNVAFELKGST